MAAAARSLVRADAVAVARLGLAPPARARARGQRSLRPGQPAAAAHGMGPGAAGQLAVSPCGTASGCTPRSLAVSSTGATTPALPCAALAAPTGDGNRACAARARDRVNVPPPRRREIVSGVSSTNGRRHALHRDRACACKLQTKHPPCYSLPTQKQCNSCFSKDSNNLKFNSHLPRSPAKH